MRTCALALSLCLVLAACETRSSRDGGSDVGALDVGVASPTEQLDLLLVYDNSGYTANGGWDVDDQLGRMLRVLTSGDRDGDGVPDFAPVRSFHVGVINGNLGAGEAMITPRCDAAASDDGILQTDLAGRSTDIQGVCPGPLLEVPTDRVFSYEAGGSRVLEDVVSDILCETPTLSNRTGCPLQQMLEATLEALSLTPRADGSSPVPWTSDSYRPPTFVQGRSAHGDDPSTNGAFLRPDSVLVVLVVASHDDYSTPNARLFTDDPEYASVELFHRTYALPDEMYPIARYVDGLVGLRRYPSRFVYAVTGGIPVGVSGESPDVILADPLMTPLDREGQPGVLMDACWDSAGYALPAVRLTQMARGVIAAGGHASAHTECSDQQAAFDRILDDTIDALRGGR